jgi:ankyrin repeat protein
MLDMKSIDVEARTGGWYGGFTCLMTAAYNGHLDICRLLIDKGAQFEAKDNQGLTSLHYAAAEGHIKIVRLLCDRGAYIEAQNIVGCRPLHLAARNGHISTVEELIEVRNADINARVIDGRTVLTFARVYDRGHDTADIVAYLISHGGIE